MSQRGGILLFACAAGACLLTVGLVIEAGWLLLHRARMQNAADAAALAGALEPGRGMAIAQAQLLAWENGFILPDAGVSFEDERVEVRLTQHVPPLLGALLGAAGRPVGATARAERISVAREGVRPFGVPEDAFTPGCSYVLKQGGGNGTNGNFQALALDGHGAAVYRETIIRGSRRRVHRGEDVTTEPGTMAGPTEQGVEALIAGDETPWVEALVHPNRSRRVIVVPLVDSTGCRQPRGRSEITVVGFARFYLSDIDGGEVRGRFIDRLSVAAYPDSSFTAQLIP